MARRASLTLQDSIDDENRTVLSSLDQNQAFSPTSGLTTSPISPQSSYARNTLSVESTTPRHGSIAGIGVGVTSPNQPRKVRLDPSDPSTWTSSHKPRAASESQGVDLPVINLETEWDKAATNKHSLAQAWTRDVPFANNNTESAPGASLSSNHQNTPQRALADPTTVNTMDSPASVNVIESPQAAQHLAPSSPRRLGVEKEADAEDRRFSNQSTSFSTMTDDSDRIGVISRYDDKGDEHALQQSSEDEASSSEQDESLPVAERGRERKSNRERSPPPSYPDMDREQREPPEIIGEQMIVDRMNSANYVVNDVPGPKQEHPHPPESSGKLSETQSSVTPRSNYRRAPSPAALSAMGDDDAELKRAQALQLRVSPLDDKVKDRSVKMIIRGDWHAFQDQDDEEQLYRHDPRLYLVCSDLSNEASFALEWTIGTLLKDGDTLLVISAIEDENAPKHKDTDEPSLEIRMESAKAAEEANSTMDSLTRQTTNQEGQKYEGTGKSRLAGLKDPVRSLSRSGANLSKKDDERISAVEKVENDFLRYVRKTTLQVRFMIEVIHCRSSRHLILNAIDELEPTLVVVGTRGLGAVKNVMLGSFSNYLVTKSSIPVMVARKRLKKPRHAKVSSKQIRMTNNLTPFGLTSKRKSLTQARID